MISNTDSTLLIYPIAHIRVKVYTAGAQATLIAKQLDDYRVSQRESLATSRPFRGIIGFKSREHLLRISGSNHLRMAALPESCPPHPLIPGLMVGLGGAFPRIDANSLLVLSQPSINVMPSDCAIDCMRP